MPIISEMEDAYVVVNIRVPQWKTNTAEKKAKYLEYEALQIKEFIQDHKSLDVHDVYVQKDYVYYCSHCNNEFSENEKNPVCCQKAMEEWAEKEDVARYWE